MPAIPRTAVSFFQTILLTRVNIFWPGFRARTPPGACGLVLYWRGWGPAPSILTLSTGYQRPHPRIITPQLPLPPSDRDDRPHGTTDPRRAEEGLVPALEYERNEKPR